ncbi:uncharacterized protein AB675_8702 [Cyphellophora attinorum]|uniref:Uncharacterized protein n=1 Tax=Cyphellophora attinorum TaxID=1664694 RepID=A0A0N1HWA7_9EURO|nr:uncharacterized protein AB675_8702 [Phialophora attinorum]KPI44400.1 hypothetical protein AB675_8702 [Phialophora attinorum]
MAPQNRVWAPLNMWYACRTPNCTIFGAERGEAIRHCKDAHGIPGRTVKPEQKVELKSDAEIRQMVGDAYFEDRDAKRTIARNLRLAAQAAQQAQPAVPTATRSPPAPSSSSATPSSVPKIPDVSPLSTEDYTEDNSKDNSGDNITDGIENDGQSDSIDDGAAWCFDRYFGPGHYLGRPHHFNDNHGLDDDGEARNDAEEDENEGEGEDGDVVMFASEPPYHMLEEDREPESTSVEMQVEEGSLTNRGPQRVDPQPVPTFLGLPDEVRANITEINVLRETHSGLGAADLDAAITLVETPRSLIR